MKRDRFLCAEEAGFLHSALTKDGAFVSTRRCVEWLQERSEAHGFEVREIPFSEMDAWHFAENPHRLVHKTGKFFSIEGIQVRTNHGSVKRWDQPIIRQPEIGILGIISKVFDGTRYFLMQAKMEPGNINTVQLSPTLQATKSNYTKIHTGRAPLFLDYFTEPDRSRVIVDQLQPEQAARFLQKVNRNVIVDVEGDVPDHPDFCWLTLGQIKQLLLQDNIVNMDARTVLSCIPYPEAVLWGDASSAPAGDDDVPGDDGSPSAFGRALLASMAGREGGVHTTDELIAWVTRMKSAYEISTKVLPLNEIETWTQTDREIRHETGRHFSVIAVDVRAGSREMIRWTQPILKHFGVGIAGFLVQQIDGILHFLVRASVEPGNRDVVDMGPTVSCSRMDRDESDVTPVPFLDSFLDAPPEAVRYRAIQSEEGGRFYHFQNCYMAVELPADVVVDVPDDYIWMTAGQITDFSRHGYFNIEARNVLACLGF